MVNNYIVGLFINNDAKTFSLTARKEDDTSLSEMKKVEASRGFSYQTQMTGLDENNAKLSKARFTDAYILAGYTKSTRPHLSTVL